MYHSETMIQMMEDLQRQASEMERHVKDMMEAEGRACGIELDKRKNARDLMHELMEHQSHQENQAEMTWAYVPAENVDYDTHSTDWDNSMHSPWAGANGEMLTEQDLWHDGGDMDGHEDHQE